MDGEVIMVTVEKRRRGEGPADCGELTNGPGE